MTAALLGVSFCTWLAVLALKGANHYFPRRRRSDVGWLKQKEQSK